MTTNSSIIAEIHNAVSVPPRSCIRDVVTHSSTREAVDSSFDDETTWQLAEDVFMAVRFELRTTNT